MTILHRVGQPRGHEGFYQLNKTGRDSQETVIALTQRLLYITRYIKICIMLSFNRNIKLTKRDSKDFYMLQKINI